MTDWISLVNISVDAAGYQKKLIFSNSSRDFMVLVGGRDSRETVAFVKLYVKCSKY